MTTELTKAAQQALKPHQIAQLVNKLRDIAREFHAHGCLRELISREVNSALTQRPAAQEVDDGDVTGQPGPLPETGWDEVPEGAFRKPSPTAGMNLGERIKHVGGRENAAGYIEFGSVAAVRALVRQYLRDLPAPQQATPEPVGEALQFPPMPEGWPARFRCDSCDGNGEVGELVSMGHFQPPERQTCPDCGGRGWTSEEPAFNAEHMREFAETHARCTRPAPGVPEGFALVPVEPTPEMKAAGINVEVYSEASDSIGALTWAEVAEIYRSMLAAAQAKGADK